MDKIQHKDGFFYPADMPEEIADRIAPVICDTATAGLRGQLVAMIATNKRTGKYEILLCANEKDGVLPLGVLYFAKELMAKYNPPVISVSAPMALIQAKLAIESMKSGDGSGPPTS